MTIERVVDAHIHLWDPARADWYPYLAGMQELDMGDISGMCRRFDQPTYFSESANWNVVKFVHVAAAAPAHSGDETARAARSWRRRPVIPTRIIGGIVPSEDHRRHRAPARRADARRPGSAASGPMGEAERAIPTPGDPAGARRPRA